MERIIVVLFIDRREGKEDIVSRVITDKTFQSAAHTHLAQEIFQRVREKSTQ
jgi:type I restriction enzyme, R subunit